MNLKLKSIATLVVAAIIVTGCNRDSLRNCEEHAKTPCNIAVDKTNIRIKNASQYDICNIILDPSGGESNYGILAAGETSCYRSFDLAYLFAYITFQIGKETFTYLPADYTNEQPLSDGNFTYTVNVIDFSKGTISIEASAD